MRIWRNLLASVFSNIRIFNVLEKGKGERVLPEETKNQ